MKSNGNQLTSFEAICAATNKNEADYTLPANGTNEEMLIAYFRRTNLIAKAYNGAGKVRRANTSQRKYTIWTVVNPDSEGLAGFRLSFFGYGCGNSHAILGARPEFLNPGHCEIAFDLFRDEFEKLMQYKDLVDQE